jgi:hypothetical protein
MTNDNQAGKPSQHPKSEKAHHLAPADAALAIELLRFDPREHVPEHRRPIRAKAKAIIEGRAHWPSGLFAWRHMRDLQHFRDGKGPLPPWHDPRNLTRPQRERRRLADEAWERRQREIAESGEHPAYQFARLILEAPRWRAGYGMAAPPEDMLRRVIHGRTNAEILA